MLLLSSHMECTAYVFSFTYAGVPKLKGSELEAACEDFSNIVISHPEFTVYKGTLSSRVEIALVSTTITSLNYWSRHSEMLFRKKVFILGIFVANCLLYAH